MTLTTPPPQPSAPDPPPTSPEEFAARLAPMRREILAHCYRMTGSVHDAEDVLQETYLRAWRAMRGFENRSSLRTWMFRIATNACLTHLDGRRRRPLPTGIGAPPADPRDEPRVDAGTPWLEPLPDALVWSHAPADPAETVVDRDTVRLAFVAALQHLTAQQRAVLLLRDVLAWSAAEVAEALDLTVAGVNSTLQRARAHMANVQDVTPLEPTDPRRRQLLERYVAAFEAYDVAAIVDLLAADVVWEMPPYPGWYSGPAAVGELIATWCPATGPGSMRLVPTAANGLPAYGLYMRDADGAHRAFQVQQVTVGEDGVRHVTVWFGAPLFARFGLPEVLDPA
ncbi:sigma-70 family RNA polymerase sigma factor [Cellulomonas sp. SLBN-39]|uniref:sigma-70 family RNA polymerase sigma factor n=1 Tax=Cellulomonas sp. SLBN-39 TaxID=2768446 RepID=UPI00116D2DA3|nr:sigma-70 family RNA polymerase sigma factor [Cellulomonas sp. SLBN-39]TQL03773.1 RNA polymerase sigma-70 factor (ECF subfamily) [Cellulomonas sp. SLBN-39]